MLTEDLEKIDMIRERLGVSYGQAKEALDCAEGDVVGALAILEDKYTIAGSLYHQGRAVVDKISGWVEHSKDTKLVIKKDQDTLFEIPAAWGILALASTVVSTEFALVGAVGSTAALVNDYSIELE